MNTKDTLSRLAAQVRQDFWEKGEVVLQSPVLVQGAECVRSLVFGLILSHSVILTDYAPFALVPMKEAYRRISRMVLP